MSPKAEAKRTVKVEAGLKKSKKEGRYTIGTFAITKRPQSANGRSDPDQGLQGSEVPAGRRVEEGGGRLISG